MLASQYFEIATLLGVALIAVQIWHTRREFEADHRRQKQEATMNAFLDVQEEMRITASKIRDKIGKFGIKPIDNEALNTIISDDEITDNVLKQLGMMERLGIGVNHQVYDINILADLSGTMFISAYKRFSPFIEYRRTVRPYSFKDVETFCIEIENIRNQSKD